MSRTGPSLPQEVWDLIVDNVAQQQDSKRTLRSCNLVSSSFCSRSRFHLFKIIRLISLDHAATDIVEILSRRLAGLLEIASPNLLETSPTWLRRGIAPYVKKFCFVVASERQDILNVLDEASNGGIASLLNTLHGPDYGLTELDLCLRQPSDSILAAAEIEDPDNQVWSSYRPELFQALKGICHSPYLKSLSLQGVPFIPISLINGASLQNLTVTNTGHKPWKYDVDHSSFNLRTYPRALCTDSEWRVDQTNDGPSTAIRNALLKEVRSLDYTTLSLCKGAKGPNQLFVALQDKLETFSILYVPRPGIVNNFPGKFPRLENLELGTVLDILETPILAQLLLPMTCDIIQIIGTPKLKKILLTFTSQLQGQSFDTSRLDGIDLLDWALLASVKDVVYPDVVIEIRLSLLQQMDQIRDESKPVIEGAASLEEDVKKMVVAQSSVDPKHIAVKFYHNYKRVR